MTELNGEMLAGKRLAVAVNSRNFKTSNTERKLQSATDPDELNAKASELGTQITVGLSLPSTS